MKAFMKMKKRTVLAFLLLFVLLFSLSSCVSYEATVDVKANGGGTVKLTATMEEETFEFLEENGFDYTELPGNVKKHKYEEYGTTYIRLSKSETASDAEEMQRVLAEFQLIDDTESSQYVFEEVTYELTEDNSIFFSGVLAPVGDNMDITLEIYMPTEIESVYGVDVSADGKNATVRVSSGDKKGASFRVESAPVTSVMATRTALIVGAAVLGAAAVAVVTVIVIVKVKHKKAAGDNKETANEADAE